MSGLAKCPSCNRMSMIRSGASQCTRCDRARDESRVVGAPNGESFVIGAVEETADGKTSNVAPEITKVEEVEADAALDAVEAQQAPPAGARRRRKAKRHIMAYGRVMFIEPDEPAEESES